MKAYRGEVWRVDFNPVVGHEQGEMRPALVVSVDQYNQGASEMVVVVPISSKQKQIPIHVAVSPPEGGLTMPSDIKCDQVRAVSSQRLKTKMGAINRSTMEAVEDKIRIVLGL